MKRALIKGSYGYVTFDEDNERAIKHFHEAREPCANREYIAYKRMAPKLDTLSVARLWHLNVEDDKETRATFVTSLVFENAGYDLFAWFRSQRLFDPVDVLLRPLLSTLEHLEEIGLVHSDVHVGNVCVRCDARGELKAKFVDFGRSVVLRDSEAWQCHPVCRNYLMDPKTKTVSDQCHIPNQNAREAIMRDLYNVSAHRDPMALVALAVRTAGSSFPGGLTLGPADDVYGLGICVVRALTKFFVAPREWRAFHELSDNHDFDDKVCILGDILRRNPAWDASFFTDLHLRMNPTSWKLEDVKKFEASARAVEIRLQGVDTLYTHFFDHMTEVYDKETSDLVKECVHPDRHHRYRHRRPEKGKRKNHEERAVFIRKGTMDVSVVREKGIIHVSIGHCWVLTGEVGSGRVKWWQATRGAILRNNRGAAALKQFIDNALELDRELKEVKNYVDWPFDFELQKREWLATLALHDPGAARLERDTEQDLRLPSFDMNGPTG